MKLRAFLVAALMTATMAATPLLASRPSYSVTASIPGPDGGWDYAFFDPETGKLFVARADGVTAVDTRTGMVTPKLTPATRAHAVLPIPGTNEILITDGNSGTARLIDKTTGVVRASIPVGEKPDAAIYDPAARQAIVVNAKSGTVSFIDPVAAKVVATVTLKPGLEFAAINGQRRLFVANEDEAVLHVVDLATHSVLAPVALAGCESPSGLSYMTTAKMLVAACANGKAAIVDPVAARLTQLIDIGLGPDAVIANQGHGMAFIPCGKSGQLAVISFSAGGARALPPVPTAPGARTGAIDEATGTIYLPTADLTPMPGTDRSTTIPGSFRVLVLKPASSG